MARVIGVDGCPAGWVLALLDAASPGEGPDIFVTRSFRSIIELPVDAIAVDIPIGLVDGVRRCDSEVRRFLGKARGSSVFPAPPRSLINRMRAGVVS